MIGRPRVHHRRLGSTNDRARELAAAGAPAGTLVTATEQTAGHGRQGRPWKAPPGSAVLMSLVLRDLDVGHALLPLTAAVAVCEACERAAPVTCQIKWPNDVWIERRKVSGILVEGRPQEGWAVLGIGVNVTTTAEELPPELRETATSLELASAAAGEDAEGRERPSVEAVLGALLERLDARLRDPPEETLAAWGHRDALRGERVRWRGGAGTAAGIDDSGALLVDAAEGRIALDAGEVHLLR